MVVEDMIYLIHVQGLAEHVQSSLNSKTAFLLVDIEKDPPEVHSNIDLHLLVFECYIYPLL